MSAWHASTEKRTEAVTEPRDGTTPPVLEVHDFQKAYAANTVLKGMSLQLRAGEIVGLLGANGAGKSTLIKCIVGAIRVNQGEMLVAGKSVDLQTHTTRRAGDLGVHCVYQEPSVCSNLTVFENYDLIQHGHGRRWRANAKNVARAAIAEIFPDPGFGVEQEVAQLSLAEAHMVEIAAVVSHPNLRVLILDEPASALSFRRANELHAFLQRLAATGVAIVYVSHKLEDVRALASRLVVLRDGAIVWEGRSKDTDIDEIITALGGQRVHEATVHASSNDIGEPILAVEHLRTGRLNGISMVVHPGEVVGLAGLDGSGQRETLREIFQPSARSKRSITKRPTMAYVTGDREAEGVFALWDVGQNIVVSSLGRLSRFGVLNGTEVANMARSWLKRLNVAASSPASPVVSLSGGNQQKALIARGLGSDSRLLLLDDPTRGVDIGTKQEIYAELDELRADGRSALFYSTENAEFKLCDRVYVFRDGEIVAELEADRNTSENIVGLSFRQSGQHEVKRQEDATGSKTTSAVRVRVLSVLRSRALLPLLLLIATVAYNGILNSASLSFSGLDSLLSDALPLLFAAAAEMLVITAADIDLGVGNAVGLANVIAATLLVTKPVLGILMLVGLVAAYGLMGSLIEAWAMPSIVVTLGASFVWLGVALTIQAQPGGVAPNWLANVLTLRSPIVPEPVYWIVGLGLVAAWFLRYARLGVRWRALGNKPRAVYQAGFSTMWTRVSLFMAAGMLVVISALLTTALNDGSDANGSTTYTLTAIAAVIVGGTEFAGGFVSPLGVLAAALGFALIPSILVFLNVATAYESLITGAILIGVLALRRFMPRAKAHS